MIAKTENAVVIVLIAAKAKIVTAKHVIVLGPNAVKATNVIAKTENAVVLDRIAV